MNKGFLMGLAAGVGVMLLRPAVQMALAADQPHMQAALHDLYHAEDNIQQADQFHDHGGYAGQATQAIQQAIADVQAGIAYRDEHGP